MTKSQFRNIYMPDAIEHCAADARCKRNWFRNGCACMACQVIRKEIQNATTRGDSGLRIALMDRVYSDTKATGATL